MFWDDEWLLFRGSFNQEGFDVLTHAEIDALVKRLADRRRICRDEWSERFQTETDTEAYTRVDTTPGHVGVEFESGTSRVDVYFSKEATDVRIGDLQFVVGRDRLSILRQHGPYPIQDWTVLYDGPLPKREESA